jgi:hypothetical protein
MVRLFRDQCGEDAVLVGHSERSVSATLGGHRRSAHKRQKVMGHCVNSKGIKMLGWACAIVMSAAAIGLLASLR